MASGQSQSASPSLIGSLVERVSVRGVRENERWGIQVRHLLRLGLVEIVLVEDKSLGEHITQQPRESGLPRRGAAADADDDGAGGIHVRQCVLGRRGKRISV